MSQKQSNKKPQLKKQTKSTKSIDNRLNNQKTKTQQAMQQINRKKINQYFFSMLFSRSNAQIQSYTDIVTDKLENKFIKGQIQLSEKRHNVNDYLQFKEKVISKQEEELFQKEAKRLQHLKLIEAINKQTTNKSVDQDVPYIFTKQEHEQWISVIMEEKQVRQVKAKQLRQLKQKEQQQNEKRIHQQKVLQRSRQKQFKRLKIQEKITRQKQQHISLLSQQIKHKHQYSQVQKKQPLFIKMQENFNNNILNPLLQEKKNQYKNLRDFKSKYTPQMIKTYQTQYNSRNNSRITESRSTRKFSQWKYQAPARVERLQSILQEQLRNNKLKVNQKQRNVQELQKKQTNFIQNLTKNYKPKIDKIKQAEIKQRIIKQKLHLRKIGLQIDKRKLGLQYLNQVKNIPKKLTEANTSSYITSQQDFAPMKRSNSQITGINVNKNNQFLAKMRQRKLNKILNSEDNGNRKVQLLKIEAEKLDAQKSMKLQSLKHSHSQVLQRQVANLAMNSIKAKISILNLMQNK